MKKLLLLCLLTLSITSFSAKRSIKSTFAVVREIYKDVDARDYFESFLNDLLKEVELFTPEELEEYKISKKSLNTLTEVQLLELTRKYDEVYNLLDRYIQEVIKSKKSINQLVKIRATLRKEATRFFKKRNVIKDLKTIFRATNPFTIKEKLGKDPVQIFFTHEITNRDLKANDENFSHFIVNDKGEKIPVQKPDNLIEVITKEIDLAKSDISINIYEFKIKAIAEALIKKKKSKPKMPITVGISQDVLEHSEDARALADSLIKAGIKVIEIDSVGINHQKMIVIDHNLKGKSKVILSSANFTNSGMNPLGDLADLPQEQQDRLLASTQAEEIKKYAKPNSNHLVVIKSDSIAAIAKHNLDYTYSGLRGAQYPVSGSFEVIDTTNPSNPQKYHLAFAPQGGLDDINYNVIGQLIRDGKGPEIDMMIFAHSSQTITDAIFDKMKILIDSGVEPILRLVGDPSFSKRDWSQFLVMGGYKAEVDPYTGITIYKDDKDSKWLKEFGQARIDKIREFSLFVGPEEYGNNWVNIGDEKISLTSKIHSKVLRIGDGTIAGSSFNFSSNAEGNVEQILIAMTNYLVDKISAATEYLSIKSLKQNRTLKSSLEKANVKNKSLIRKTRKLRKSLIKQISENQDDTLLKETVQQIKNLIGKNKATQLIFTLGQEIPVDSPFQKTNFIFEFDNNIVKFDRKTFTFDDFIEAYNGDNPSKLMGPAFNELRWALKGKNGSLVKVYSKIVSNEDLEKIFEFLKKKKHIEDVVPTKNFIQMDDSDDVVKFVNEEVKKLSLKKVPKGYLDLIGADGETREKLHLFSFSARSKEDVEMVQKSLSKKSKNLTKTVKIGIFNNGTLNRSNADNYILNKDGTYRDLDLNELLDWKKTLLTNCSIFLSKKGKK